ncbi:MAG: hypothetical protein ACKO34_01055 [Vampirovibrionales bacterium]
MNPLTTLTYTSQPSTPMVQHSVAIVPLDGGVCELSSMEVEVLHRLHAKMMQQVLSQVSTAA